MSIFSDTPAQYKAHFTIAPFFNTKYKIINRSITRKQNKRNLSDVHINEHEIEANVLKRTHFPILDFER